MPRLCSSWLLSLLVASAASAVSTVVPNAYASGAGDTENRFPFLVNGGVRYQQVFAASQFSGAMPIQQIALRNYSGLGAHPFTATIASLQIWLSTVAANPDALSATFADNIGANNTLVYDGSVTLSSTNAAGPGNTHVFDVIINLQTPFTYDPSLGNLLLDVKNNSGSNANSTLGIYFDAAGVDGDSISKVFGPEGSPDAISGTPFTSGLIVQFSTVPEPSSFALTALGVALIECRRRNTHRPLVIAGLLGLAGWRRVSA